MHSGTSMTFVYAYRGRSAIDNVLLHACMYATKMYEPALQYTRTHPSLTFVPSGLHNHIYTHL